MILKPLLVAAATLAALPAFADEARMSAPIEAGSLSSGDIAFVAYYVPLADDAFEVTATWLGDEDAEPHRLSMRLDEGDRVAFSLPGHMDTLLTFSRDFDAVTVRAEPVAEPVPESEEVRNASL